MKLHIHIFSNERKEFFKSYGCYYVSLISKTCRCGKKVYYLEDSHGRVLISNEKAQSILSF